MDKKKQVVGSSGGENQRVKSGGKNGDDQGMRQNSNNVKFAETKNRGGNLL